MKHKYEVYNEIGLSKDIKNSKCPKAGNKKLGKEMDNGKLSKSWQQWFY